MLTFTGILLTILCVFHLLKISFLFQVLICLKYSSPASETFPKHTAFICQIELFAFIFQKWRLLLQTVYLYFLFFYVFLLQSELRIEAIRLVNLVQCHNTNKIVKIKISNFKVGLPFFQFDISNIDFCESSQTTKNHFVYCIVHCRLPYVPKA